MGEDRTDNRTTYVGMAGLGPDAATLPVKDRRCGLFGYERRIRLADVTDGHNSTVAVVETAADIGPWAAGGRSTLRSIDPDERPYVGEERPFGRVHRPHWHRWLRGPGYANVVRV